MNLVALAWKRFDALFEQTGSVRAAALMRIGVGLVVIAHLEPFVREMLIGVDYADRFYSPWVSWYPEAPKPLYFAMLSLCLVTALLTSLGLWTRWTLGYTAFFVVYNFYLSETFFRHNRNFLLLNLVFLVLMPCGRMFSLDAVLSKKPNARSPSVGTEQDPSAALWPQYLMRFEVACMYAASGGSKLLNADWRSGLVTWDRLLWYKRQIVNAGVPHWAVEVVTDAGFHAVFAKVAIATELFIALGLWFRPTRYWAIWLAIMFHTTIGIALKVQIFSPLAILALMIWATPKTRQRRVVVNPNTERGRRLLKYLPRLDWLTRFEVQPSQVSDSPDVTLEDKDGQCLSGKVAAREIWLLCPLLFPVLAPFVLSLRAFTPNTAPTENAHPA